MVVDAMTDRKGRHHAPLVPGTEDQCPEDHSVTLFSVAV
jgi:hypothetical protein